MTIQKYNIFMANLNPKRGHVQAGIRPVVIVQNNILNKYDSTVIAVPLTTTMKKVYPSEFIIESSKHNGLTKQSRFLGNQIATIDKSYLAECLGSLEHAYHPQVQEALGIALDMEDQF